MKSVFTFFLLLTIAIATAQPSNDECTGAMPLQLSAPTPCPNSTPVTNTFNVTNINATPTAPYPAFNMCTIGGQTSAPASEVWFTFVPTTNQLTITVSGGLATPNIVVFTGTNCGFLTGVQCARGAAPLSLTLPVVANQQYYLMVSGGSVSDQSNFTLSMTSFFDCNPCLQAANLVATPAPINGTYNSGQTVQFCYTITRWNTTGTIEWLHAIELEMGPGWDMSTFVPTPPPSCDGRGSWGWYNSWVSCATGRTFGPGFAYDSSRGVGCGGTANDGNPGNNWGDGDLNGGVNCANIGGNNGPPSVSFCWTVRVGDCPPNSTGNSLNVVVNVLSDGDSGSWTFTGCNSGVEYNFLASAVCCNDGNPNVSSTPATCSGVSDGTVTIAGFTVGDPYNYYIFNSSNQIVFSALGVIGPVTASNLPAGNYSIVAVNVLTNCQRTGSATIVNGPPPQATAGNGGPYCIGSQIQLQGGYTWSGTPSSVTYQWSGPGGFSSNQQNPTNATQPGTYNLIVSINGCPSPPVSTTVVINSVMAGATASPTTVCPQAPATLTASGGISYQWSTGQSGSSIVVNPTTTTTYTVTVTNATGCTATANVTVSVHTVPQLSLSGPPGGCAGELVIVSAVGGPFSQYQWSSGQTGNFIAPALTVPQSSFSVTATDPNGCTATANITIPVSSNPVLNVSALPASICEGTSSTLTASGATSYQWSTGDNGSSISVSPTSTTTYNVTASNAAGCLATSSVTVNVQPVPSLSITGPFNGCTGDVVVLSAVGGPFAQYQWSNGQTGSTAVVDLTPPMSNFSVTGITAGGCTVTANISISVSNNPVANATASLATICAGQSTTLSATGGVTYLWSTGAGTQNITVAPTATTTYQVTVTNQGGCTDVASVTVNVVQPIAAPVVSCGTATANSVTFSWPPVPNATGYTVNVLSGQSGTLSGTTYTVSGLAPGANVTIQVTALSGTICANTTTTFSCAPLSCPPVTVDIASPGSFCIGAGNPAISLTGNISGGAGNGTRNWSGPGIINAATGMFHPDTAGVGNHSIILTYTEGVCTYADTLTIAVRPVPTAAFTALPAIILNSN